MKHDILAPWATPVPDAPYPATIADLLGMPDDAWRHELIEGRLVRMPGSGTRATLLAQYLAFLLMTFARLRRLGNVSGPDGQYNLTRPGDTTETALIPDVAFVRVGRLPTHTDPAIAAIPALAPDLVAEVASPTQYHPEMDDKARLYPERGVRLVWILWPERQQVDVWRPGSTAPAATLGRNDQLDGSDVLPGFSHPVADLFDSYLIEP